ncbi:hypothetical protein SGLAM104S_03867 [Streptomyces glaucescens]
MHPLIATAIYRDVPDALRGGMHNAAVVAIRSAGLGPTAAARHLLELPCEGKPEAVDWLREAAHESICAPGRRRPHADCSAGPCRNLPCRRTGPHCCTNSPAPPS